VWRERITMEVNAQPAVPSQIVSKPSGSYSAGILRFARREPTAAFAASILIVIVILSIVAPWIAPQNPHDLTQLDILDSMLPPLSSGADGKVYYLGTDDQGRDILSGILYGLQ